MAKTTTTTKIYYILCLFEFQIDDRTSKRR